MELVYYKICQMYKLLNNTSPAYLVSHLPLNRVDNAHALSNNNDIRVPLSRTLSHRKSFLPSTIRLWTALDLNIQHSTSLFTFKRLTRTLLFPKPTLLFSYGQGRAPVYHARFRMGLSTLNQHRRKYNYITDLVIHVISVTKTLFTFYLTVPRTKQLEPTCSDR